MKYAMILKTSLSLMLLTSCNASEEGGSKKFANSGAEKKLTEEEEDSQNKEKKDEDEKTDQVSEPAMISGAFLTCSFEETDMTAGGCMMNNKDKSKMDITKLHTSSSWNFYRWVQGKEVALSSSEVEYKPQPPEDKWHIRFKLKTSGANLAEANSENFLSVEFNKQYKWNSVNGSAIEGTTSIETDKSKFNKLGEAIGNVKTGKNYYFIWPNPKVRFSGANSWSKKYANFLSTSFETQHAFNPADFVKNGNIEINTTWLATVLTADSKSTLELEGSDSDAVASKAELPYSYNFGKGDCFETINLGSDQGATVHGNVIEYSNYYFALIKRHKSYYSATENYQATATLHIIPKSSAAAIGLTASELNIESSGYVCK